MEAAQVLPLAIRSGTSVQVIGPGDELPQVFCRALGIANVATFIPGTSYANVGATRLFCCKFQGDRFIIREQAPQVCQDHLDEQSAAIVTASSGVVYLWVGSLVSDVVYRLARGAADEVVRRMGVDATLSVLHQVCLR